MGCCTYNNLCEYGIPLGKACPNIFQDNDVPCRCPITKVCALLLNRSTLFYLLFISQGTYTFKPAAVAFLSEKIAAIESGRYWAHVTVVQNSTLLACYKVFFDLYEFDKENFTVIQV